MPEVPHVSPGQIIRASHQNVLIDQVNQNTQDIEDLKVAVGDPEAVEELVEGLIDVHVNDATPHPAYDDLPSFTLIFENGLV
mgnify:CR=1 FL=1|jgi:hypothetical protein